MLSPTWFGEFCIYKCRFFFLISRIIMRFLWLGAYRPLKIRMKVNYFLSIICMMGTWLSNRTAVKSWVACVEFQTVSFVKMLWHDWFRYVFHGISPEVILASFLETTNAEIINSGKSEPPIFVLMHSSFICRCQSIPNTDCNTDVQMPSTEGYIRPHSTKYHQGNRQQCVHG